LAESGEAFWPTTDAGRAAMAIETRRLEDQEAREKTTGWRLKTWRQQFGRRVSRHVKHLVVHHTFAKKVVPVPYDPFWELEGRPEPWETRVPEAVQAAEEQAAKDKAEKEKTAKDKARAKRAQGKKPSARRSAVPSISDRSNGGCSSKNDSGRGNPRGDGFRTRASDDGTESS
jgi:hypothetical protein